MAFITKDQKTKTIAQILYEQFISVFGMPAKLLSDQDANFSSALVEELWHLAFKNAGLQHTMRNAMDK